MALGSSLAWTGADDVADFHRVSIEPSRTGRESNTAQSSYGALETRAKSLDAVEDRVARVEVEACRGEESGADVASPERVTATTIRIA
jgi:hypothetical protein